MEREIIRFLFDLFVDERLGSDSSANCLVLCLIVIARILSIVEPIRKFGADERSKEMKGRKRWTYQKMT